MLVELGAAEWLLAVATLSEILMVPEDSISIHPDGKVVDCELSDIGPETDLVVSIDDWEYMSASYQKVMRYARNYVKSHPIPDTMAKKKRKYSHQQVAADITVEVNKGVQSVHNHLSDARDCLHDHLGHIDNRTDQLESKIDNMGDLIRKLGGHKQLGDDELRLALENGVPASTVDGPASTAEGVAPTTDEVTASVSVPEVDVPEVDVAVPKVTSTADAAMPKVDAPAQASSSAAEWGSMESRRAFGRGETTVYIPPSVSEQGDSGDSGSGGEDSSSEISDASWHLRMAEGQAVEASPSPIANDQIDADQVGQVAPPDAAQAAMALLNSPPPVTSSALVQPDNAEDAMAHAFVPSRRTVTWPKNVEEFESANDAEKVRMYKDLYAAFVNMSKTAFDCASQRDISLAHFGCRDTDIV